MNLTKERTPEFLEKIKEGQENYWTPERKLEKSKKMKEFWERKKKGWKREEIWKNGKIIGKTPRWERKDGREKTSTWGIRSYVVRFKLTKEGERPLYYLGHLREKSSYKLSDEQILGRFERELPYEVRFEVLKGRHLSVEYCRCYEEIGKAKKRFSNFAKRHKIFKNRFYLNNRNSKEDDTLRQAAMIFEEMQEWK